MCQDVVHHNERHLTCASETYFKKDAPSVLASSPENPAKAVGTPESWIRSALASPSLCSAEKEITFAQLTVSTHQCLYRLNVLVLVRELKCYVDLLGDKWCCSLRYREYTHALVSMHALFPIGHLVVKDLLGCFRLNLVLHPIVSQFLFLRSRVWNYGRLEPFQNIDLLDGSSIRALGSKESLLTTIEATPRFPLPEWAATLCVLPHVASEWLDSSLILNTKLSL